MKELTIKHVGIGDSGIDNKGNYAWHDFAVCDAAGEKLAALCMCMTSYGDDEDLGTGDGGWSDLTDDEMDGLRAEAADLAAANGGHSPG